MSNIHDNGKGDKTLHDDLDRIGRAYDGLEKAEPPDLLDQAVLNSAHRAVEKKTGWMQFGWLHGLTTAAVIVLAIALVLRQQEIAPLSQQDVDKIQPSAIQYRKEAKDQAVSGTPDSETPNEVSGAARQQTPAPASPVLLQEEAQPADLTAAKASRPQPLPEAREKSSAKMEEFRLGTEAGKLAAEPVESDEEDVSRGIAIDELRLETSHMADQAESLMREERDRSGEDETIGRQLAAIIELKKAGDEAWKTELAEFMKRYPDYPVPEELRQ